MQAGISEVRRNIMTSKRIHSDASGSRRMAWMDWFGLIALGLLMVCSLVLLGQLLNLDMLDNKYLLLLMAGILGGIFTLLAVKLCGPLAAAGLGWLYFALMGLIAVLLGAFGSIFNTYAGLYLPKDNDLLLSMPVPVSSLVAARLSGVYLMGLMYSAVVILPAVIIYWGTVGVTASAVLGGLVLTLLISLAVLVLSCALG